MKSNSRFAKEGFLSFSLERVSTSARSLLGNAPCWASDQPGALSGRVAGGKTVIGGLKPLKLKR